MLKFDPDSKRNPLYEALRKLPRHRNRTNMNRPAKAKVRELTLPHRKGRVSEGSSRRSRIEVDEKEQKMAKSKIGKARGYAKDGEDAQEASGRGKTEQELDSIHRQMGRGGNDPNSTDYEFEGDEVPTANDIKFMELHGGDAAYEEFVARFGGAATRRLNGAPETEPPMPRERPLWGEQVSHSSEEYNYPPPSVYGTQGVDPKIMALLQAFQAVRGREPVDYAEFERSPQGKQQYPLPPRQQGLREPEEE